jgi:predicted transcriptional regulator of viral defense system
MSIDTDADAVLAAHAAEHHGVFRGAHARMAGLTERQIERRIASGRWIELYRDVYLISGAPPSWKGKLLAACWAGGFRAAASRRSAAAVHGVPGGRRDLVEITCPRWRRARHGGLFVHESKALGAIDVTVVDGIPVTTVARTLFDLGAEYRIGFVELAVENALRRGLVTLDELDRTVRRLARPGRPGSVTLRQLVEAQRGQRAPTGSDMETRLLQLLRAAGLPDPVKQYEVWDGALFVGQVDLAYPEARIAIEYDSDEFHTGRLATKRDRARRHRLLAAGWLPIDVGPHDLRNGGQQLCAALLHALASRTHHRGG